MKEILVEIIIVLFVLTCWYIFKKIQRDTQEKIKEIDRLYLSQLILEIKNIGYK